MAESQRPGLFTINPAKGGANKGREAICAGLCSGVFGQAMEVLLTPRGTRAESEASAGE